MTREELIAFDTYIMTLMPLDMKKAIDDYIRTGKLTKADIVEMSRMREEHKQERKHGKAMQDDSAISQKAK